MMTRAFLGLLAILTLLGGLSFLPPYIAFFAGALVVILFPGVILTDLVAPSSRDIDPFQKLVVYFVTGTAILGVIGFAGLLFRARLTQLTLITVVVYAVLTLLLLARKIRVPVGVRKIQSRPDTRWIVTAVLLVLAVGAALLTLLSQRDSDDWFYLAHIQDYVANHPLGAENSIVNMGRPASARQWFGGAWWFVEALVSKVTGGDPVTYHQVFFPLLMLPLSVFAVYALAREIFRSAGAALLASFLQVLFYLSSAFPYRIGGWMFFCRTAHDKTIACFLMVPVAIACALRFIHQTSEGEIEKRQGFYILYCIALIASVLLYPLGPVWCSLAVIPIALAEWLRWRTRRLARVLMMLVLPLVICAVLLAFGRTVVSNSIEVTQPTPGPLSRVFSSFYLPGKEVSVYTWTRPPYEAAHSVAWVGRQSIQVCNPLYITRYPLAVAGLVLTLLLIRFLKSHFSARFLFSFSLAVLFFTFTPLAVLSAHIVTWKMVVHLSWILPWGLVIAFFLYRLPLKPLFAWLIVLAVALALARGNPLNYTRALSSRRFNNRPTRKVVEVFRLLASEPAPQGVILTSKKMSKMVAAFVPDAYPIIYRSEGAMNRRQHTRILKRRKFNEADLRTLSDARVSYIIIKRSDRLSKAVRQEIHRFSLEHEVGRYGIWKVSPESP